MFPRYVGAIDQYARPHFVWPDGSKSPTFESIESGDLVLAKARARKKINLSQERVLTRQMYDDELPLAGDLDRIMDEVVANMIRRRVLA